MAFPPSVDRLVRKEEALTTIRELPVPQQYIGLQLCPWMDVTTDDVIFDFTKSFATGLAPARAEDAESELAQKDLIFGGYGRAAVIDWALKDHYDASDVSRYRDGILLQQAAQGLNSVSLPATFGSLVEEQARKFARDDAARRRKLDNRIEWLIMTALSTGGIAYNDGKVIFAVDFGRPAGQHDQAPASALYNGTTHDPIGDFLAVKEYMRTTHGVNITRAVTSAKVVNSFINSDRFTARAGIVVGGTPSSPIDLNYIADGWNPTAALAVVERATGIQFTVYDAQYRTRAIGSTTPVLNRFVPENQIIFLPDPADVAEIDSEYGFGRTLTSPHPEGNWQPGFYEWEKEDRDPWGVDRGTGVKAFPVFLHMNLSFTMRVFA